MNDRTLTKIQRSVRDRSGWRAGARCLLGCTVFSWALILTLPVNVSGQSMAAPAATAANLPWSLSLAGSGLLESDSVEADTPRVDTLGTQFSATVGRAWTYARGAATLNGNASQYFYEAAASGRNQFTYGFGFGASYAATARLTWTVSDTLSSNYARDTLTLIDAVLLPPRTLTRFNSVSGGLTYALSPRTRIAWGVNEQNVLVGSSAFPDTSTLGTTVTLTRQITQSQSLSVAGDYARTFELGTSQDIGGLSGTWQAPLGSKVTLSATGGVRAYTPIGDTGTLRYSPIGSLGISFSSNTHIFSPNDTFGVQIGRSVSPELGIGTLLTQGVSATYGLSLTPRLGISGAVGVYSGTDSVDSTHVLIGRTGTIAGRYALGRGLGLAVSYGVYVRSVTSNRSTSASVTYNRGWR